MAHETRLHHFGLLEDNYPRLAKYVILVRDVSGDPGEIFYSRGEHAAYLEKVVKEALSAEFIAYASLPDLDVTGLDKWFVVNSPAMKEIKNVLNGVKARDWHLQNPMNPSTCRLLSVVVKNVTGNEAEVATIEYWYLRWWNQGKGKYAYPYRETNQQLYILRKNDGQWKVFLNIRPVPCTSQPLRWSRRM